MITASSLSRLLNCPGSSVLPRAENYSQWAERGHEEHEELSDVRNQEHEFAHAMPPNARSEVKLAFDVSTHVGRILGEGAGRAYGEIGPWEIVGSADVVGVDRDAVIIADFKTGYADVEPAATNTQLAFYALAACRALGADRAIVRIIYTKTRRIDEAELDAMDLASFANRLEQLHRDVAAHRAARNRGEAVSTREGTWCRYCASIPYCGAKNALLIQVAERGLQVLGDSVMTPARAAAGYEQLVKIESLVRDARKRLETYVDENGPIDLGNGRMFGRYVRHGNERLDGDVAVRAIAEVVGESAKEFEALAIERKTTKSAIDRAAKVLACKRGTAPAVIRKIRELGGATHAADSMPVGEFVRDRDAPATRPEVDTDAVNRLLAEAS